MQKVQPPTVPPPFAVILRKSPVVFPVAMFYLFTVNEMQHKEGKKKKKIKDFKKAGHKFNSKLKSKTSPARLKRVCYGPSVLALHYRSAQQLVSSGSADPFPFRHLQSG